MNERPVSTADLAALTLFDGVVQRLLGIAAGHLEASRAQLLQVGREGVITAG